MKRDDDVSATMSEEEVVARAFALLEAGGRGIEQAALLLDRRLNRRVRAYFVRHKVHEHAAEELVSDLWLKLIQSKYDGDTRPVVWMWIVARTVMLDWHRRENAEIRGKRLTLEFDDDSWLALLETSAAHACPEWMRLCVERAMWQMEQDDPARSEVLRMVVEGWTDTEIAIYYGADPKNVSSKQRGAARDRAYQARKRAREYFKECKE